MVLVKFVVVMNLFFMNLYVIKFAYYVAHKVKERTMVSTNVGQVFVLKIPTKFGFHKVFETLEIK